MRPEWVLVLTVSALLICSSVLSSPVEARQLKSLLSDEAVLIHHDDRSLRTTKESNENEGATGENDSEERISWKAQLKLIWWETIGVSTNKAKQKLKIPENVFGPALANEEKFPVYLSYVNRIERNDMWTDANRHIATTEYWLAMEKRLGKIDTPEKLDAIKNTNEFRIFKRYAHIFDDSIVGDMRSGYYDPIHYGNDLERATNMMEWNVRADIWGKFRRDPDDVQTWLDDAKSVLKNADFKDVYKVYLTSYSNTKVTPTLLGAQVADKAELKRFMLAKGSKM
ncbi:RxLR effector protein [Phytophthora megakarya]|uniref:RxLR effector protein n=1 Tax=Phytophthora megakarya TaxID=4795 RepID=A0A225VNB0_9STRA|nr:RxLR effector protein [Phytophthora megakarya]